MDHWLRAVEAPVDLVCVRCPADIRHRAGYSPKQFGSNVAQQEDR